MGGSHFTNLHTCTACRVSGEATSAASVQCSANSATLLRMSCTWGACAQGGGGRKVTPGRTCNPEPASTHITTLPSTLASTHPGLTESRICSEAPAWQGSHSVRTTSPNIATSVRASPGCPKTARRPWPPVPEPEGRDPPPPPGEEKEPVVEEAEEDAGRWDTEEEG